MKTERRFDALKIKHDKFSDETFPDFFAIYLEENGEESLFEPEFREHIARSVIDPEHSIVRGVCRNRGVLSG